MKKRGRPRNADSPTLQRQDTAIAKSVRTLAGWGFSLRSQIAPALAGAVEALYKRELTPEAIEVIYERSIYRRALGRDPVESLRERRPIHEPDLRACARRILQNGGDWPKTLTTRLDPLTGEPYEVFEEGLVIPGDLVPTPKHADEIAQWPRIVRKQGK